MSCDGKTILRSSGLRTALLVFANADKAIRSHGVFEARCYDMSVSRDYLNKVSSSRPLAQVAEACLHDGGCSRYRAPQIALS